LAWSGLGATTMTVKLDAFASWTIIAPSGSQHQQHLLRFSFRTLYRAMLR
jgi:hypothetical protein